MKAILSVAAALVLLGGAAQAQAYRPQSGIYDGSASQDQDADPDWQNPAWQPGDPDGVECRGGLYQKGPGQWGVAEVRTPRRGGPWRKTRQTINPRANRYRRRSIHRAAVSFWRYAKDVSAYAIHK